MPKRKHVKQRPLLSGGRSSCAKAGFREASRVDFVITYPAVPVVLLLILFLAARWFTVPRDLRRTEWMLVACTLTIPASALAQATADALSRFRPLKYDQFVYHLDSFLGQPSFVLGRIIERHAEFKALVSVSYGLLPVMIVATFAVYLWMRTEAETITIVWAFLLNLFLAVPLYLLFPVCGPVFAFPDFPFHQPVQFVPHLIALSAAPNGVPSVHTSSALLILWFLRRWWWGACAGIVFLALTVLSTLASGQHYAFDLVCAVPYAFAIVQISNLSWKKSTSLLTEISS